MQQLSALTAKEISCSHIENVPGGSINTAVCLKTNHGDYFLKYNKADRFPGMFECEKKGLEILRNKNVIEVPEVVTSGVFEDNSFLLEKMIIPGKRAKNYSEILGTGLASLHKFTSSAFGLDHDNYIGSLKQLNTQSKSGIEFMIQSRFVPLITLAQQNQLISKSEILLFEKLFAKLEDLLPDESPSLLHGDLWSGNIIIGKNGHAVFLDPAIYYGYRETDLAMAKLFGGFDAEFYESYNNSFPLKPGWENRIGLFQLYPLLVHLNLFGRGYWASINEVLKIIL